MCTTKHRRSLPRTAQLHAQNPAATLATKTPHYAHDAAARQTLTRAKSTDSAKSTHSAKIRIRSARHIAVSHRARAVHHALSHLSTIACACPSTRPCARAWLCERKFDAVVNRAFTAHRTAHRTADEESSDDEHSQQHCA